MKKQKFLSAILAALMIIMSVPLYLMPASAKIAPSGAKEYKGHTYYVYKSTVTWKKAKALCESRGGHLATITSSGENNFVKNLVNAKEIDAWLGATDEAKEGTWKWVTGEKWSFTNWNYSQPDNEYGKEHYLAVWEDENWNDYPNDAGSHVQGYVCEWDMSKAKVDSVRFAQTSASVYYGSTKTLKLLNTTSKITWSTSNKAVATVSSKGVVTGKGLGSCTITAKVGSKSYKCKVTVKDRNQKATVSLKTTDGGIFLYGTNSVTASFVLKSYSAAKVTVYIVNADGKGVYKKTFTNAKKGTTYKFNWNGKKSDGSVVPAGSYRMKVVVGSTSTYSSYISFKTKNDFSGGNGSKSNPFLVSSTTQFKKIIKYPTAYFKQTKSLNFNYESVGNLFTDTKPFAGVYDAAGYTISCISSTAPLFYKTSEKAQIKNVKMSKCSVVNTECALLVYANYGKITNCSISGVASGSERKSRVGLIAVYNYGSITNCKASGSVNASGDCLCYIGAIASENKQSGKIIDCISSANMTSTGRGFSNMWGSYGNCVGGIVGNNAGLITGCEATGKISSASSDDAEDVFDDYVAGKGGIAGYNSGNIVDSSYTGSDTVDIAGNNDGVIA